MQYPFLLFLFSFVGLWVSVRIGVALRRGRTIEDHEHEDFNVIQAATLTLLGLIIGFTFAMAANVR